MPVTQYRIKEPRDLKCFTQTKYRPKLDDLIRLYKDRKIANCASAFMIAKNHAGNTVSSQAAVKIMEK